MSLYDFSQDFYPTYSVQPPAPHFDDDEDEDMSDVSVNGHPTSPIPTYVYGPDKSHPIAQIPKTVRGATVDGFKSPLRISLKSGKAKNRQINPSSSSTSRRREKAYRCPVSICFIT